MINQVDLKDIDLAGFEDKVYVIAAEVIDILKELSRENQKQINSKLIAERMFQKESVKNALFNNVTSTVSKEDEINFLKGLADKVLNKFSEIVPSHMGDNFISLKEIFKDHTIIKSSTDWLDSPIGIIKKYIDSISARNNELEEFLKQTMQYLAALEAPLANELSSQQQKFEDDRNFQDSIFQYMDMMREECNVSENLDSLKMAFINRIENITASIETKRKHDMARLKETEKTIEEMQNRMNEVQREADEVRKRAQEVEAEAYRDTLTGLHNRKAYNDKIEEVLAHVKRYNIPASLMICDIDYFKNINDTFGHKVGDLALKKLGELLKDRLRINDFISRYGGEEFAIVLPHTDIKGAIIAGEGIRSYIDQSIFSYKDKKIPLTISVGISSFNKNDDINTVFERADKALYLAKNSGRNKIKSEDDLAAEETTLKQT
jgi:diguanylate cyclase